MINRQLKSSLQISDRPFVIRDPVHGYLTVAVHERIVIDHALTQRLRRITQTGLAEYVFPEARTSRFIHSLGAMHLASRFVLAAIENAEESVAVKFFDEIGSHISKYSGQRENSSVLLTQDGTLSALATVRASFRYSSLQKSEIRQLMAIVEAALRLAALFHDLGHLPLSHDVEYALQDYAALRSTQGNKLSEDLMNIASKTAPHEEIGHRLADRIFSVLSKEKKLDSSVLAAFELAGAILHVENPTYDLRKRPQASALQWLHSLVDGEIDADRADYLLRDGQALGLDFAHYDVDRLVNSLVLVDDDALGFVTAVKERGLAALESYCLSRSRSSQVFIRHHKVAQVAAALRHVSVAAFSGGFADEFLSVLENLGRDPSSSDNGIPRDFAVYDDSWWFQTLRRMQSGEHDSLTQSCLDLVLDRRRTLRSVWKRRGDLTKEQIEELNTKVSTLLTGGDRLAMADTRRTLLKRGILISPFKFSPYTRRKPDNTSVMLIKQRHATVPVSDVSPLIAHLWDLWGQDVHLYAFTESTNTAEISDVISAIMVKPE